MGYRGHVLIWAKEKSTPSFVNSITDSRTIEKFMKDYITEVVTRYGDKIYAWDVVNEVVPDGQDPDELLR